MEAAAPPLDREQLRLQLAQETAQRYPHHIPAMQAGAECWRCPLQGCGEGPVPPSLPPPGYPIDMLVVAEAPGQVEVDEGATLVGPSGREIRRAIRDARYDPSRAAYTNTMLCRPPGGDLTRYHRELKKTSKKLGQKIASPIDCCRPRLKSELARSRYAILMGGASLEGVGITGSIMKLRGTPVQIQDGPPAMPIPHAAFVMRDGARAYRPVFRHDVNKAVRISTSGSTWRDPAFFVATEAQQLANFLFGTPREFVAVDTETDGKDPWTCRIRRIGLGTGSEVAIYSPLSVKGHELLSADENLAQKRVIAEFFRRAPRLGFHNFFGFDSIVLSQHGMPVEDARVFDSLIGHHIGPTSELPHGLDFLASIFTDAPRWKDDVKHSNVKSDEVLDHYLSFDIAATWSAAPHVWQTLQLSQQVPIYERDVQLSGIGRSMSLLGVQLNREKQWKFASEYQDKYDRMLRDFKETCGRDVNPASPVQVRKFIYEDLGLPVLEEHLTDADEPSTDEPTLLALLGIGVDKRAEKIIHALLGFREADKILSTYTGRIERVDDKGNIIEPRLIDGPRAHSDGRLRATWKVYGTTSGRWSSGDPNMQNIIKKLRAMYEPAPGNVFVGADYSALEARILALLAEDDVLLEAFRLFDEGKGPDIHVVNACTVFRCTPEQVTDETRTFAKRFVYGLSYGAQPPKIHQTMSLLRDENLKPVFPGITLPEIERVYKVWWDGHPKISQWRKSLIQGWRRHGFIATPWHGRKRYFIGGENHEEMYNHPIQGAAADLQNEAVVTFVREYPFDFARRCGLLLQVHDQLVAEVPEHDAERVAKIMEYSMTRRIGPMLFPAKAKVGRTWKEVS